MGASCDDGLVSACVTRMPAEGGNTAGLVWRGCGLWEGDIMFAGSKSALREPWIAASISSSCEDVRSSSYAYLWKS